MSSFYLRQEPHIGDTATHTLYGSVALVGKLKVEDNCGDTFWIVELPYENNELKIVRENDLEDIGYYGD